MNPLASMMLQNQIGPMGAAAQFGGNMAGAMGQMGGLNLANAANAAAGRQNAQQYRLGMTALGNQRDLGMGQQANERAGQFGVGWVSDPLTGQYEKQMADLSAKIAKMGNPADKFGQNYLMQLKNQYKQAQKAMGGYIKDRGGLGAEIPGGQGKSGLAERIPNMIAETLAALIRPGGGQAAAPAPQPETPAPGLPRPPGVGGGYRRPENAPRPSTIGLLR